MPKKLINKGSIEWNFLVKYDIPKTSALNTESNNKYFPLEEQSPQRS